MSSFKNSVAQSIGTGATTVYTAPASTTTTLIGLSLANIITSQITVDVTLTDQSAGTTVHLIKNAPLPTGSTLVVVGGDQKVVLEESDFIQVQASDGSSVDVVLSMLEQT